MAEFQRVEFVIGKDGKVTEKVGGVSGPTCTDITAALEKALGQVESQEFTGEYHQANTLDTDLQDRLDQRNA